MSENCEMLRALRLEIRNGSADELHKFYLVFERYRRLMLQLVGNEPDAPGAYLRQSTVDYEILLQSAMKNRKAKDRQDTFEQVQFDITHDIDNLLNLQGCAAN